MIDLSRIVVLNPGDAAVQALDRAIPGEHGRVEVTDTEFAGLTTIKRRHIFP